MPTEKPNEYLDYLIDPKCQGINRPFSLSFENKEHRSRHPGYFLPKVEVKDYIVTIVGNLFW